MSLRPHLSGKRPVEPEDVDEMKTWRFLKVMPTSILQESLERIPTEFASKFWSESSVFASFNVNHISWTVKVSKNKNKLQLGSGWNRFTKDNFIGEGSMVLFKYKGDCMFNIYIFDPAGCEILQYREHYGKQKIGCCNKKRQEETLHSKHEREEEVDEEDYERNPFAQTKFMSKSKSSAMGSRKEDATNSEASSIQLEEFVHSLKNPLFFANVKSYRNELLIPAKVINIFGIQFDETILLEDPKKRKWKARVAIWKDGRTRLAGWNNFRKYNLITDKDACVCELMHNNGSTCHAIKVHIFRNQKIPDSFC